MITHPPGGEDHISLSWQTNEPEPMYKYGKKRFEQDMIKNDKYGK